jgi:hypothetical protein
VGNADGFVCSHLLFVDDTLIFCHVNADHLCHLCCLFLCFEVALGLKVDLDKSELVLVEMLIMWKGWLIFYVVGSLCL